jgi:hypothetical protein
VELFNTLLDEFLVFKGKIKEKLLDFDIISIPNEEARNVIRMIWNNELFPIEYAFKSVDIGKLTDEQYKVIFSHKMDPDS